MKTHTKINPSYGNLQDYIADIPSTFDKEGETLFRGRNEVKRFNAPDGTNLVVKRFGHLPTWRRVIYSTVAKSKARRAYEYGNRFLTLGYNTPTPVAYIEITEHGILSDAYFISLHSDFTPLFEPLVKAERFDSELADDVAILMASMHANGVMHGDPNLNNILYKRQDDGKTAITLIDTNRSHFGKYLSMRSCLKNLMRVSHRRDLMRQIVGRYATLRGLDPVVTVDKVFALLERFERNRERRHKIKDFVKKR
ncbi:MAG: lipopolysaccharide kinase InaA family protein [Muribaculaceae bacterium]|nr:lipopolysaccharide kinase InaA family protein [Muribaculaceae bacterium]